MELERSNYVKSISICNAAAAFGRLEDHLIIYYRYSILCIAHIWGLDGAQVVVKSRDTIEDTPPRICWEAIYAAAHQRLYSDLEMAK